MIRKAVFLFTICFLLFPAHAHFMSRIWPQKGLAQNEIGSPAAKHRILVAGTSSAFRDTVLFRLMKKFQDDSVYFRIINLKNLSVRDPGKWDAVLLVNRCVAWDYDNRVKKFIRNHHDSANLIVFTTSGDPEGCIPEKKMPEKPNVDGYSSASAPEKIAPAVEALYQLLVKHLQR